MTVTHQIENEQTKLWNGAGGRAWVEAQELLDGIFKPFEHLLVEEMSGTSVLDVGCGTGGTTVAVARKLRDTARCTGIDISEPMIAAARTRAERESMPATFICANAQFHAFEPESFDRIISRFGIMFFDDSVQAFANLRRAGTHDAELQFIAWRSAAENAFMTVAERAAAPLLPCLPARPPHGPGQFAFADPSHVGSILGESGWAGIDIQPIDVACSLPENELVGYLTWLGPVGRVLQDADDETRMRIVQSIRAAFDPYVYGSEVRFTAACWMVRARTSRLR